MPIRNTTRLFILFIAGILLASVVCAGDDTPRQLQLPDINGRKVKPLELGKARAVVFLFIRTDCPISNRYAPEVRRLHQKFASKGVTFWLVYPGPDETIDAIRTHLKEYEYSLGALRDPRHALVKLTGARVTPEAAVFVPGPDASRMLYRGRIDDRVVDFGKARPAPTTRDLESVLSAIVDGKPLISRTTNAVGCFIPDLQ